MQRFYAAMRLDRISSMTDSSRLQFKSVAYAGQLPGPRLIVTGAVHGNEKCGTQGDLARHGGDRQRRARDPLGRGDLRPDRQSARLCDARPRGRAQPQPQPRPEGRPRGFRGPRRQLAVPAPRAARRAARPAFHARGDRALRDAGPARQQRADRALRAFGEGARAWRGILGVSPLRRGLARHLRERRRAPRRRGRWAAGLNTDPRYGVGTTEYMRSVGGYAITLECGQHDAASSPEVAYRAIRNVLDHPRHHRRAPRRSASSNSRRCASPR